MLKQSIIFLHGGPGFKDYLEPYLSDLESDFNCVFYNQKQGQSISIDDLIHELDIIVKNQPKKPILLDIPGAGCSVLNMLNEARKYSWTDFYEYWS